MREVNGRDHIPWIQQVPENWETAKLVRVTHISTGDMDTIDSTDDGPYPFYVRSPIVRKADRYTFDTVAVLMSGDGAGAGRIFHRASGPFACHQRVYCIEFSEKVTRDFGFYYLSTFFPMQVDAGSAKSTVDSIRKPMLNGMPIAFPSVFDQRIITGFLDYRLPEIDGLVEKLQREVQLLERYRRELIAHTVTRGLDPDVPMKDSGIDWAGDIPKTWRTQPFVALFSIEKKINSDLRIRNALQFRNGEIVVKPGWDPEDQRLDETLATYKVVTPGMIVINGLNLNYDFKTKRIGLVTQNGVITSAYITLSVKPGIDERFISYLLKSMDSRLLFHGMTEGVRKILSWTDIRREKIPVPPLQEQTEIADYLEGKSAQIDSTIERINKQIELLEKYRKQIINDAVTGKVRVGEMA